MFSSSLILGIGSIDAGNRMLPIASRWFRQLEQRNIRYGCVGNGFYFGRASRIARDVVALIGCWFSLCGKGSAAADRGELGADNSSKMRWSNRTKSIGLFLMLSRLTNL